MAKIKIDAQEREGLGKNKVKKIRAEKNVPAAIFEKGEETHQSQFQLEILTLSLTKPALQIL